MTTTVEPLAHSDSIPTSETNGHAVAPTKTWTLADSAKLYGIQQWGNGYFSINNDGHVAVHPTQDASVSIDLKKLVDELRERDIALPILLRLPISCAIAWVSCTRLLPTQFAKTITMANIAAFIRSK